MSVLVVRARLASVALLVRYVTTRTLMPFAVYCILFGVAMIVHLSVR